jgi:hypothetical protein
MICHSDVTNSLGRKIDFRIVASHNIVAAQSGKIFGNNHIDHAVLHVIQQFLKSRSCKIHTGETVINIEYMRKSVPGSLWTSRPYVYLLPFAARIGVHLN